jgi:DNA invertase Pin-like site-specific DNA recombinase
MPLEGVFAEFERTMIQERVRSGMQRAKANGTKSGKPIGSNNGAAIPHCSTVDQRRSVAENEYKDLSCIAEAIILDRDPAENVGGDVIEKDEP